MEHRKPTSHSLWLCPAVGQGASLLNEITRYAERFETPAFEPHVTLLGDAQVAPQASIAACRSVMAKLPKVTAHITGVSQTADYFMSLFLDLELDGVVGSVRAELAARLAVDLPPYFRPHLSLAYGLPVGQPGEQALQDLSRRFVGETFTLCDLKVVHSAKEIAIKEWRTIHVERLK